MRGAYWRPLSTIDWVRVCSGVCGLRGALSALSLSIGGYFSTFGGVEGILANFR